MNTAQLEGLFRTGFTAIGMPHEPAAIDKFVFYLQEVMKWNERTNLTGHKSEEDIIGNLFIDSLACTKVLLPGTTSSVLDIGTGAGFPRDSYRHRLPSTGHYPCRTEFEESGFSAPHYRFTELAERLRGTVPDRTIFRETGIS